MSALFRNLIQCFFSEFIGTAFLMFAACMGSWESVIFPNTHFQISVNISFVVMSVVQIFGHVSGGHINPIVSVAACINGIISVPMLVVYFLGQFAGAIVGFGLLESVLPMVPDGFCMTLPNEELNLVQVFVIEFVGSSILIAVCCAIWDSTNADKHDSAPIRVGFTIGSLVFSTARLSGGSMNPTRSFAPALLLSNFDYQWLYWVSPLSSAVVTSLIYIFFFKTRTSNESNETVEKP